MKTTELAKRVESNQSFDQMLQRAELLLKSGFLPTSIKTKEQAATIILTGREFGIGDMEALRSINVIQGKPCLAAQLMLGLCYRTKQVEDFQVVESTAEVCEISMKRKGHSDYVTRRFTRKEADDARFSQAWDKEAQKWKTKDNWIKQPATMLQWRCTAAICRLLFPDAVSGLYIEEELAEDVVIEGEGQNARVVEIIEPPAKEEVKAPESPKTENVAVKVADIGDDELPHFEMPFGKFKGFTFSKIVNQIDGESGKNKGIDYLEWFVAENMQKPEWVAVQGLARRFLKLIQEAQ
jgi:hypothetical protein